MARSDSAETTGSTTGAPNRSYFAVVHGMQLRGDVEVWLVQRDVAFDAADTDPAETGRQGVLEPGVTAPVGGPDVEVVA